MSDNLKGTLPDTSNEDSGQREPQIQVNSLDFLVSVDRLSILRSNAQGIYHYGGDNNYPRKIIQASERSSALVTAKSIQALFIQGLGFPGATAMDVKNDTAVVINSDGETAYDLLQFWSNEKTNINVAIHVNYNALGEAVEFNLIQYDFVRRKVKTTTDKFIKHIITNIWHLENDHSQWGYAAKMGQFNEWVKKKESEISFIALECFDYNPDPLIVREQIELSGGIENYPGQLFYKKRTKDIYQKATFDSVADDFQFLAESKLSSLSNVQNGYSAGGVFKYFGSDSSTDELKAVRNKVRNVRGAGNTGRIVTVGVPLSGDMKMPDRMFEPTEMQNIDKLYDNQRRDARENIEKLYKQPDALRGSGTEGNLAIQQMEEAFDIYNTVTKPLRQESEIELTTLFKNSVFANQMTLPIEIEPLKFESSSNDADDDENEAIRAESQARLKGTVGGVQGVLQIQDAISRGVTQYEAGIELLIDIYGYSDEQARKILGEPIDLIPEDSKTVNETTENETISND